jgi:hypothetical protein
MVSFHSSYVSLPEGNPHGFITCFRNSRGWHCHFSHHCLRPLSPRFSVFLWNALSLGLRQGITCPGSPGWESWSPTTAPPMVRCFLNACGGQSFVFFNEVKIAEPKQRIYIYGCIWFHYIIEMMQLKFQPIAFEVPSQRFVPLLCAGAPKITQEKLWRQVDFFRHFKVDPLWWTVGTRSGKPHLPKIPEVFHHLFGSLKVEDGWNRVDLPENGDLSRHYIWNPVAHDPKQFAWSSMIFHTATLGLSRIWPWDLPSGNLT